MGEKQNPDSKKGFGRNDHETKPVSVDFSAKTGQYAALTPAEITRRTQEPQSPERDLVLREAAAQKRQADVDQRRAEVERIKHELRKEATSEATPQAQVLKRRNHRESTESKPEPEPPKPEVKPESPDAPRTEEEPKQKGLWGWFRKRKK